MSDVKSNKPVVTATAEVRKADGTLKAKLILKSKEEDDNDDSRNERTRRDGECAG